jgi:hypothetical protein
VLSKPHILVIIRRWGDRGELANFRIVQRAM